MGKKSAAESALVEQREVGEQLLRETIRHLVDSGMLSWTDVTCIALDEAIEVMKPPQAALDTSSMPSREVH